jgi:hypothetical protein
MDDALRLVAKIQSNHEARGFGIMGATSRLHGGSAGTGFTPPLAKVTDNSRRRWVRPRGTSR